MVGIMFLGMALGDLGFSALSSGLRAQMGSAHSLYWTFTFPWSVACMAVLSAAVRLAGRVNAFLVGRATTASARGA
jgi:hypothetical protein